MFKQLVLVFYIYWLSSFTSIAQVSNEVSHFLPEKPITIVISESSYPYHFINENKQPEGLMVDFWRLWASKLGQKIEFVAYPWPEGFKEVESGELDLYAGLTELAERNEHVTFFSESFPIDSYIYIHQDINTLENIEQLLPYTIGVVSASSSFFILKKQYPHFKVREYASRFALYEAALKKEILAFTESGHLLNSFDNTTMLQQMYLDHKKVTYFEGALAGLTQKDNKALIAYVEQGIALITPEEKSLLEKKWLAPEVSSTTLNVTFSKGLPPYMALSPSGKPQGVFIDMWRLWSEKTGVKINFIAEDMQNSIALIKQKKADLHIAYPSQIPSLTELDVAHHIYTMSSQVYVLNKYTVKSLNEMKGMRVGVFETAPYLNELKANYPEINFTLFINHNEMINAAEHDEIDAMISETENMNVKLIRANLQSSFYLLENPKFESKIYVLLRPDKGDLQNTIVDGFNQINLNQYKKIESQWLNNKLSGYYHNLSKKVTLSNEEAKWLSGQGKIKIGIVKSWRPIEFIDEENQPAGVNVDIFSTLASRIGLNFEYKVFDNVSSLFKAFENKNIDLVLGIEKTIDRANAFYFTEPYWNIPWVILHRKNSSNFTGLNEFDGKVITLIKGYYFVNQLKEKYPNVTFMIVDNVEQALLTVQQGISDGYIDSLAIISELIKRESIIPLSMFSLDDLPISTNHIAIHKEQTELLNILNKALASLSDEELQKIFDKWFEISIKTGLDKRLVTTIAAQVGIVIVIIIFVFVYWNRRLSDEVNRRKKLENEMKHIATHDELTGLANRSLLKERIESAIAMHQRQQSKMAILFIDLDGFKAVNDNHGHDIGDELLKQVAFRLTQCIRKSDTVGRFGGDEFVILLTNLHSNKEAKYIAEKILAEIHRTFDLSQAQATIGCSIGIAVYPRDGSTEAELLKVADTLMYSVKSSGKNNYIIK